MKIIGKTEDGFILEASKDDVAAMEGLYSRCRSIDIAFNDIDRLRSSAENIIEATSWIKEFREK